jgi:hypothetical protein
MAAALTQTLAVPEDGESCDGLRLMRSTKE